MNFNFAHNNINVLNLDKSLEFYKNALNLVEWKRKDTPDYTLVYLGDNSTYHKLELTYIKERKEAYNLGENEIHLALEVDDFEKAYNHHKQMNCICFENKKVGIYFISDPDNYWIEILPKGYFEK